MAAFFTAFTAFLASLPVLLKLLAQALSLVEKFVLWAQKNELEKWMADLESKIDAVDNAKTPEQKQAAARGLAGLLRSFK